MSPRQFSGRARPAGARIRLASLACAAAALVGCVSSSPADETAPPAPAADLVAMKQAAGIEDCPPSDPTVPPHPRGLPDIVVNCLGGGRPVRLAGLRGRPMIINVWAQWCAPCREEAPFLADVAAKNRSRTLILGIDYADPRPDYAIEFAHLTGWTYPQLVDAETVLKVPLQLGAGAPQTLFVTADGEIVHRKAGALHSAQELRDLAKEHLGVTL